MYVFTMSDVTDLSDKVELLTDSYAKEILAGCYERPKTAQQISWEHNIPIAATYRRLNDLHEVGLLEEIESEDSSATKYKTALDKAILTFEDGKFTIEMKLGEDELETEF